MLPQLRRANVRVVLLAALLVGVCAVFFARGDGVRALTNLPDFRAFYCAGAAINARRDPYLAEPLRSCEIRTTLASGAQPTLMVAMPAPLPGYALAAFALLARCPFAVAAIAYTGVLIASLIGTAYALGRLTPFPLFAIAGALALCDGWVSTLLGQIVPISLLLLCASAAFVARGRDLAAAACAAAATIEPHVALPACLALFVLRPKTRIPLVIGAALLAAIALATLGWRINVDYVTDILRAHALAEAGDNRQLSLTALLWRCGVGATPALLLADASYVLMVAFGTFVARRLARQANAPELLVLVPPAFALVGGPFIHTPQLAVAVPALLVLIARNPAFRGALAAALLIMAVPWLELAENPLAPDLVAAGAVAAAIALGVLRATPLATLTISIASAACAACERVTRMRFPPLHLAATDQLARAASGSLSAEVTWAIHLRSTPSPPWYIVSHLPAWSGLLLMVGICAALAFRSDSRSDIAPQPFRSAELPAS